MPAASMKQLLEAGVHFGHQTRRWNPKMAPYIYGERNGIYIINLQKTAQKLEEAYEFVKSLSEKGEIILFVGTKKQAQEAVEEDAKRCGMFYVNQRWLGGTLTNFATIKKRINRLKELEEMEEKGKFQSLPPKEVKRLQDEKKKLEKLLGGIKNMTKLPSALFLVDLKKERIALLEAKKMEIPVIAIVDTNCDPEEADYIVPGNDDAIRAIKLFSSVIADAVIAGKQGEEKILKMQDEIKEEKMEDLMAKHSPEKIKEDSEEDKGGEKIDHIR